jgi:hypothetical protein
MVLWRSRKIICLRSHDSCRLDVLFAVKLESSESLLTAICRSTVALFIVIGVMRRHSSEAKEL